MPTGHCSQAQPGLGRWQHGADGHISGCLRCKGPGAREGLAREPRTLTALGGLGRPGPGRGGTIPRKDRLPASPGGHQPVNGGMLVQVQAVGETWRALATHPTALNPALTARWGESILIYGLNKISPN